MRFKGKSILAPQIPLDNMEVALKLKDGKLVLAPPRPHSFPSLPGAAVSVVISASLLFVVIHASGCPARAGAPRPPTGRRLLPADSADAARPSTAGARR